MKQLFLKSNLLHIRLKEWEYEVSNPEVIPAILASYLVNGFEWQYGVELIKQYKLREGWSDEPTARDTIGTVFARLIPEEKKSESAYKEVESSGPQEYGFISVPNVLTEKNAIISRAITWLSEDESPRAKEIIQQLSSIMDVSAPSESQHLDKLVALREFIEAKIDRFVYWDEENKKWFESDQKAASESQEELWREVILDTWDNLNYMGFQSISKLQAKWTIARK